MISEHLPPLANLFLVRSPEPPYVAHVADAMARNGLVVLHRGPGLVVGLVNLPGRPSTTFTHPASGRVAWFAEGEPGSATEAFALVDAACDAPRSLRTFSGDFSFLVVDGERTVAVRSGGGLVPWLVSSNRERTILSTRMVWFHRLLPVAPDRDLLAHVALTDGITLPDRRTPWTGVTAVRSGHVEIVGRSSRQSVEYWDPVWGTPARSGGQAVVEEAARELRRLVVKSLNVQLDADGRNLFGLSGGVDSSCLAALAVGAGHSLMSLTMDSSSDPSRAERNRSFVQQICELTRPRERFTLKLDVKSQVTHGASGPRLGMPIGHPLLIELAKVATKTQVTTFTGGELADDLFAGPYAIWHDWLNNVSPIGLIRSLNAPLRPIRRRGLVRLWAQASLGRRFPGIARRKESSPTSGLAVEYRRDLREEYLEWERRVMPQFDSGAVLYGRLEASREFDGWLLQNWEACSELNIRRVTPFVTRDLYNLACSLVPGDHALPPKRVMRIAFAEDLPAEVLWRPDKGGATPATEPTVHVSISREVERVLSSEALARLAPVKRSASAGEKQQSQLVVPAGLGYSLSLLGVSLSPPD